MPRFNPIRSMPNVALAPPEPPPLSPAERDDLITRIAQASMRPFQESLKSQVSSLKSSAAPDSRLEKEAWENSELDQAAQFAEELAKMDGRRLQEQADYWLKSEESQVKSEASKVSRLKSKVSKTSRAPVEDDSRLQTRDSRLRVEIKATTHTKHGYPIWIAQLTEKVDRAAFKQLLGIAKSGGGYWSSFGPVEIHGFIFRDEAKALAFQTLVSPMQNAKCKMQNEAPAPVAPVAPESAPETPDSRPEPPAAAPDSGDAEFDAVLASGRTIWNSDGTAGPCLICAPPEPVVAPPVPPLAQAAATAAHILRHDWRTARFARGARG